MSTSLISMPISRSASSTRYLTDTILGGPHLQRDPGIIRHLNVQGLHPGSRSTLGRRPCAPRLRRRYWCGIGNCGFGSLASRRRLALGEAFDPSRISEHPHCAPDPCRLPRHSTSFQENAKYLSHRGANSVTRSMAAVEIRMSRFWGAASTKVSSGTGAGGFGSSIGLPSRRVTPRSRDRAPRRSRAGHCSRPVPADVPHRWMTAAHDAAPELHTRVRFPSSAPAVCERIQSLTVLPFD